MGRFGNGQGAEFAEAYILEYWRPRLEKWVRYRNIQGSEVIQANENTYIAVKEDLGKSNFILFRKPLQVFILIQLKKIHI